MFVSKEPFPRTQIAYIRCLSSFCTECTFWNTQRRYFMMKFQSPLFLVNCRCCIYRHMRENELSFIHWKDNLSWACLSWTLIWFNDRFLSVFSYWDCKPYVVSLFLSNDVQSLRKVAIKKAKEDIKAAS